MRFIFVAFAALVFVKTVCSRRTSHHFPNLHMSMNALDLIYYFNVDNHDNVPPYEVITPKSIRGCKHFLTKTSYRGKGFNPDKMEFLLDAFQARYNVHAVRNALLINPQFQVIYFKNSRRNFTNYRSSDSAQSGKISTSHYLAKVVQLDIKQTQNASLTDHVNGAFSIMADGIHGSFRMNKRTFVIKPLHPELLRKAAENSTRRENLHIVHATRDSYPRLLRGATREVREFVKNVIQKGESIKKRPKRRAADNSNSKGHKSTKQTHTALINLKPIDTGIHLTPILLSANVDGESDARSVELLERLKNQRLKGQNHQQTIQNGHKQHVKKFPRRLVENSVKDPDMGVSKPRSHVQKFSQQESKVPTLGHGAQYGAQGSVDRTHVQKFPATTTHTKTKESQTGAGRTHVKKFGNHVHNAQTVAQRNHVQKFSDKETSRTHVQKFPNSGLDRPHVQKFPNKDVGCLKVQKFSSSHAERSPTQNLRNPGPGTSRHVQKFPNQVRDSTGQQIGSLKPPSNHVQKFPNRKTVLSSEPMTNPLGPVKQHIRKFTHPLASPTVVVHSAVKGDAVHASPRFSSSTIIETAHAEFPPIPESTGFPFIINEEGSKSKTGPLRVSMALGVVVDYSMYSTMLKFGLIDQEQQLFYILSLYNEVQAFYKEPSLAENIQFTLSLKSVGFITEENNDLGADPFVPQYWENLCQGPYNLDDYDHLQALTMLDLFDLPKEPTQRRRKKFNVQFDARIRKPLRKSGQFQPKMSGMKASNEKMRDSVGMALLASTCSKASHCSVVEMSSVSPSLSVADELAHSMGANHEGANGCPIKENPSSFLISPSEMKNGWTQFAQLPIVSACAIQEMMAFLKGKGNCLLKAPPTPGEGLEFKTALKDILHRPFSADEICKLRAGPVFLKTKKWKHLVITAEEGNIPGICQSLICNGIDGSDYAWETSSFVFGPAPTGTSCNRNGHVCYNFQCVDKASIPAFYDGGNNRLLEVY